MEITLVRYQQKEKGPWKAGILIIENHSELIINRLGNVIRTVHDYKTSNRLNLDIEPIMEAYEATLKP